MARLAGFVTCALLFSARSPAGAATAPGTPVAAPVRIVALGDSLTAGYGLDPEQAWPALVGERLRAAGLAVEVVNAGVSGDTTAGGRRRIDWLLRAPIDVLVLALGANDALRGLPIADTEANLRAIIAAVRAAHPQARVLLAGMLAPPNMGREYGEAFAAVFPRVAAAEGCALLPFLLAGVAGAAELNLGDGIHPNAEGQQVIAQAVGDALARMLDKRP
jgi:acyl-CoA thioesterase-1